LLSLKANTVAKLLNNKIKQKREKEEG